MIYIQILTILALFISIINTKNNFHHIKEQVKQEELNTYHNNTSPFINLQQQIDVLKSRTFIEKEISTTQMSNVYSKLTSFLNKHDLELKYDLNSTVIDQIPSHISKQNNKCGQCSKEFKNITFLHLHHMRKHFPVSLDYSDQQSLENQAQFLILSQACQFLDCRTTIDGKISHQDDELFQKKEKLTKEHKFRRCVYFFNNFIEAQDSEIIDFCFDIVFFRMPEQTEDSSELWESFTNGLMYILFFVLTGLYYYYSFFNAVNQKKDHSHSHSHYHDPSDRPAFYDNFT